jgi:hypothetical protein
VKATVDQIERLLARHKIASTKVEGSDSAASAHGGWRADLTIQRRPPHDIVILDVGNATLERSRPTDETSARKIVAEIRIAARLPHDPSFEHMLAELLLRASNLFEDVHATTLEFSSLRLHSSTYHIGEVTLLTDKPPHVAARLEPDSHDRRAVFDHRHGDSTTNPR